MAGTLVGRGAKQRKSSSTLAHQDPVDGASAEMCVGAGVLAGWWEQGSAS